LIDVAHAGGFAGSVGDDLPRHGAHVQIHVAAFHGGFHEYGGRRKVRVNGTSAAALRAEEARATVFIHRAGEDRQPGVDDGDAQFIAGLLHHQLVEAWFGRWEEVAVGFVVNSFFRTENADHLVDFIVPGFYVVVTDGPVVAMPVYTMMFKIVGSETEGDAAP